MTDADTPHRPGPSQLHPMKPPVFPRTARVRAPGDFDRVFKQGRRTGQPFLALHWHALPVDPDATVAPQPANAVARLGLAVSRKVDKKAVGRNRIKRCLREAFRHARDGLRAGDYVVVARPGASQRSALEIRAAFHDLLRRSGALPPADPVGTMPASLPPSHDAT